jgi:general secretion pathway protein I
MMSLALERRAGGRGFTLLEVLVAIAILGLGLTVLLSSQVGLFSSSQRAGNLTLATNLARCKMNEVETDLLSKGYPLVDSNDEGPCCDGESQKGFRCEWKVDRVILPEAQGLDSLGADGGLGDSSGLGALGALATLQTGPGALGENPSTTDLAGMLTEASGGNASGMAGLAMSFVYPDLKPMLEESIRKVTVKVVWTEGANERDLAVQQYITNPVQGGLDPNAAKMLEGLENLPNLNFGPTPTPTPTPTGGGR